jgi:hypothetical protein
MRRTKASLSLLKTAIDQCLKLHTTAERIGNRKTKPLALIPKQSLGGVRIQVRRVETDAGATYGRIGAATQPKRQIHNIFHTRQRISWHAENAVAP